MNKGDLFYIFLNYKFGLFKLSALLIALVLLVLVTDQKDLEDLKLDVSGKIRKYGVVNLVQETDVSKADYPVEKHYFSFRYKDLIIEEVSFSTYYREPGEKVIVEFLEANPYVARIEGDDNTARGPAATYIMFWVVTAAALAAVYHLHISKEFLQLTRYGIQTNGRQLSVENAAKDDENNTVYKFTYQFKANSAQRKVVVKDTDQKAYSPKEKILYHPQDPDHNVIISSLPEKMQELIMNSTKSCKSDKE